MLFFSTSFLNDALQNFMAVIKLWQLNFKSNQIYNYCYANKN